MSIYPPLIAFIDITELYPKPAAPKDKLDPEAGAESPFGLLNNAEHAVHFYPDKQFTKNGGIIGIHPQRQHRRPVVKAEDLVKRIEDAGNPSPSYPFKERGEENRPILRERKMLPNEFYFLLLKGKK
ncbi:YbaK/EbsC family protein [Aedoeadaptatus acetigenes]|uniref:hypothetical protein n=1 Tax=Aedoeadaptatus acetigenes TaxID=2981723 RepID=UPI0011DD4C43|nr:hypothetical protein [Aedoeadaptatus acetigenes]MCU6786255.1 hypothetical protein [Aedoeadaptatus acetigenes]